MMKPVARVHSKNADSCAGEVVVCWRKTFWNMGFILASIIFAPIYFTLDAFILFLFTTYLSLLVGHSVGMHRMMIHRSFEANPIVEKILIYIGVLVGMAGPYGVIRIHDTRDWAQRQPHCHLFFSHKESFLLDLWWQLTCTFKFEKPPSFTIEPKYSQDRLFQWLEKTWRWHQLLLALLLYILGGFDWVVWGIFVRVSLSVVGHWTITYFCHNPGPGRWRVKNAGVQASNIPGFGILTYGECWHNNHHAFPESARIGLEKGQCDPAWRFIQILNLMGLASKIGLPREENQREDIALSS